MSVLDALAGIAWDETNALGSWAGRSRVDGKYVAIHVTMNDFMPKRHVVIWNFALTFIF